MIKKKLSNNTVITTCNGKKVEKRKCKFIKGKYYLTGDPKIKDSGECYLVDGKYNRFDNKLIEYDYEIKKYVTIHKTQLKFGVVDVDGSGKKVEGYFSPNLTENVLLGNLEDGEKIHCISEVIAKNLTYRECFSDGVFYQRDLKNANFFKRIVPPPVNKRDLPYDSRFSNSITQTQFENFYKPVYDNTNLNILGDFLDKQGITFGLEFETSTGFVPNRICYKYGLLALRDGSIQGLEYVTVPYSGKKGLYALRNVCLELMKRTKFDQNCALHLHLGGLNRDEESILSSYILGYLLQDEFFIMQPAYKRGGLGVQNKDFCKPLSPKIFEDVNTLRKGETSILSNFKRFFNFVSDGVGYSNYNNKLSQIDSHPSDPSGNHKWQIRSRYKWLNFVPIIFGNKQTLEFRQHTATFNFEKVINFLFTCAMFIKASGEYKSEMLKKDSKLYKSLLKDPSNNLTIISTKILSKFPELRGIKNRNDIYNNIRKEIMSKLKKNSDVSGSKEYTYDKLISNKLDPKFWGNE